MARLGILKLVSENTLISGFELTYDSCAGAPSEVLRFMLADRKLIVNVLGLLLAPRFGAAAVGGMSF